MDEWMEKCHNSVGRLCFSVLGGDDGDMTSVHAVPHHQKSNP